VIVFASAFIEIPSQIGGPQSGVGPVQGPNAKPGVQPGLALKN